MGRILDPDESGYVKPGQEGESVVVGGAGIFGTNSGYIPGSSSNGDITQGLYDDVLAQAGKLANSDDANAAKANYLQWLMTVNQRQFDTEWRDNERNYSSATSQLQRLMATGMSYSAALAMLSGAGDNGQASGLQPQQIIKGNQAADFDNVINGVGTAASALTGFGSAVFSGISALSQVKLNQAQIPLINNQASLAKLQAQLGERSLAGMQIADNAYGAIRSAIDLGEFSPSQDDMSSSSNLLKAAYAAGVLPRETLSELYSNNAGIESFNHIFNDTWSTAGVKDDNEVTNSKRKAVLAQNIAALLSPMLSEAELSKLNETIKLLIEEQKNTAADTKLKDAERKNVNADTQYKQYENAIIKPKADVYTQYAKDITTLGYYEMTCDLVKWSAYYDNVDKMKAIIDEDLKNQLNNQYRLGQWISFDMLVNKSLERDLNTYNQSHLSAMALYRMGIGDFVRDNFVKKVKTHKDPIGFIQETTTTLEKPDDFPNWRISY